MFIQPERGYIFWVYKSYKGDKKMSISLLFIMAKVEKHEVFSLKLNVSEKSSIKHFPQQLH